MEKRETSPKGGSRPAKEGSYGLSNLLDGLWNVKAGQDLSLEWKKCGARREPWFKSSRLGRKRGAAPNVLSLAYTKKRREEEAPERHSTDSSPSGKEEKG